MLSKLIDFLPAVAFFITYQVSADLVLSTMVIIGCCVLSFSLNYFVWHKISRMQIFLTAMVLLFGLPTILLNDPEIIKMKVSVVNFAFALAIFVFQCVLKRNPFAFLFGQELPIAPFVWKKLSFYFMLYFVFAGLLNIVIAFYLPTLLNIDYKLAENLWVNYKTFGNPALNFAFSIVIFVYLYKRYPDAFDALKDFGVNKVMSKQTAVEQEEVNDVKSERMPSSSKE